MRGYRDITTRADTIHRIGRDFDQAGHATTGVADELVLQPQHEQKGAPFEDTAEGYEPGRRDSTGGRVDSRRPSRTRHDGR